ncbi:MAG: hypothetical protein F2754_14585 [Actinobacteria bacterium]|jgi:hypothetical protein|uniref:Unannotated protein n=1 Tax=freshwater metagenome TaxID=449393 RepID=A0A6J7FD17_9ZZZZ|nr:hypothetical protein [Actinomycetota bacterium]MSW90366.1 hypothetical protein [Actinomycetota bacterium]MSX88605.1 hypothetical protein [Actinomycetota bacterium]MSY70510.1 hypothetical protein [Actinomycetota bacterium]
MNRPPGPHTAFDAPSVDTVPWVPPIADQFTEPWWQACRERRLLVRACATCGRTHFPPRPACPHCWSDQVSWHQVTGLGSLYTYSVVRENDLAPFGASLPYVPAIVALDEGPRLMTSIVDSSSLTIAVDARVEVVFVDRGDWTFPAFRIA